MAAIAFKFKFMHCCSLTLLPLPLQQHKIREFPSRWLDISFYKSSKNIGNYNLLNIC